MKPPRPAKTWYIATTHVLTAGFVMPFLAGLVVVLLLTLSGQVENEALLALGTLAASIIGIWLGTIYSIRYLKRAYMIPDAGKVVRMSTVIFFVGQLALASYQLIGNPPTAWVSAVVVQLVLAGIFYFLSSKYLMNTPGVPAALNAKNDS